jgi:hypothetical protein
VDQPERAGAPAKYGLRCFNRGREIVLMQIGGGGRLRLRCLGREWWEHPCFDNWDVYPALVGERYPSEEMARSVAANLVRLSNERPKR